jgi:hypothetical protein
MWAVQGNKATLSWRDGIPFVVGIGEQLAHLPTAASAEVMRLIEGAQAMWTLAPCRSIDFDLSGDTDFVKRVRATPNDAHFAVSWHPEDDEERAVVGFRICLPDGLFAEMLPSWQGFITGGANRELQVCFGLPGVPSPGSHHGQRDTGRVDRV